MSTNEIARWFSREAGLRYLARRKAPAAVALLTMALALGANSMVFSVTNAFMLNSFAVPDPGRLFVLAPVRALPGRGEVVFADAYPNYQRIRQTQRSFTDVAVMLQGIASWELNGEARALASARVSASFFATVGVQPMRGRAFTAREEGPNAQPVAIIGYNVWQGPLAGDPNVIGRVMLLNGAPHTIIGVMPPGFTHPQPPTEIWLPFDLPLPTQWTNITGARTLGVWGRLKPGLTAQAARAELDDLTRRALEASADNKDFRYTLQSIRQVLVPNGDRTVRFVQAGALLLVLLAIANLAALMIAWGFERRQEIAVRLSLGARPRVIVRMLIVQSLTITVLGGLAGLLLARLALPYLRGLDVSPALAVFFSQLRIDWLVLSVTGLAAALAGCMAGALPAWFARAGNLADPLRATTRSVSLSPAALRWQKTMVGAQATFACCILTAAVLVGLSFRNLSRVPLGFEPAGRTVARIQLQGDQYSKQPARAEFGRRLLENLAREPELVSFGFSSTLPVGDPGWGGRFYVDAADAATDREAMLLHFRRISDGYLRALQIPLLQGRYFDSRDGPDGKPVALISQSLARRLWPDQNALGRILYRAVAGQPAAPVEIIGVVGDVPDGGLNAPPGEAVYVHWQQISVTQMSIVAVGRTDGESALAALRRALRATDPVIAANNTATLASLVRQANALPRLQTMLLAGFALVALLIVVLGCYGVMTQLVLNRERELAMRLLLGAVPAQLGSRVLMQVSTLTTTGIALGLSLVWFSKSLLTPLVFAVDPRSASAFAASGVAMLVLALSAAVPPALRAMRIDLRSVTSP